MPGPGTHDPSELYTTKASSSFNWSICKIDKNKKRKFAKQPGPFDYDIPSKLVEKPQYGFGLKPFIDP